MFSISDVYEDWRKPGTPYVFHAKKNALLEFFRYNTRGEAESMRLQVKEANS